MDNFKDARFESLGSEGSLFCHQVVASMIVTDLLDRVMDRLAVIVLEAEPSLALFFEQALLPVTLNVQTPANINICCHCSFYLLKNPLSRIHKSVPTGNFEAISASDDSVIVTFLSAAAWQCLLIVVILSSSKHFCTNSNSVHALPKKQLDKLSYSFTKLLLLCFEPS